MAVELGGNCAINQVTYAGKNTRSRTKIHIVFDSYLESAVNTSERSFCAADNGAIDTAKIGPDVYNK